MTTKLRAEKQLAVTVAIEGRAIDPDAQGCMGPWFHCT